MRVLKSIWRFLLQLKKEIVNDQIAFAAAAIAFYAWLSLFPLMLVAIAGLGIWLDSTEAREQAISMLSTNLPALKASGMEFDRLLQDIVDTRGRAGLVGGLLLIWAGSMVAVATQIGLNRVFGVKEDRNWLLVRLWAMGFILIIGVLGVLSLTMMVLLSIFVTTGVERYAGWVITSLVTVILFTLTYIILPRRRIPFRYAFAGGCVTAFLWITANRLLILYFGDFTNLGNVYGPLAGTVTVLLACYYLALVTLIGSEVTHVLLDREAIPLPDEESQETAENA